MEDDRLIDMCLRDGSDFKYALSNDAKIALMS